MKKNGSIFFEGYLYYQNQHLMEFYFLISLSKN